MLDIKVIQSILGKNAVDTVTGLEGKVTAVHHYLSGMIQAQVQPPAHKAIVPDAYIVDVSQLTLTGDNSTRTFETPPADVGDRVLDDISGVVGVIVTNSYCLNGCIRQLIESAPSPDSGKRIIHDFDAFRLEKYGTGVTAEKPSISKAGGPSRSVSAYNR